MTTKAEQKQHTNETILQSAARLLREKGISGTRVVDVMKGAGLTVGGFYAHFASKEALIDTAIRRLCAIVGFIIAALTVAGVPLRLFYRF